MTNIVLILATVANDFGLHIDARHANINTTFISQSLEKKCHEFMRILLTPWIESWLAFHNCHIDTACRYKGGTRDVTMVHALQFVCHRIAQFVCHRIAFVSILVDICHS